MFKGFISEIAEIHVKHAVGIGIAWAFLIYARIVGLDWGLPYPMHPDERNMVVAISQMSCHIDTIKDCLNPHFFAYGQFPLYLAYAVVHIWHAIIRTDIHIPSDHIALALRSISAGASIIMAFYMVKIVRHLSAPFTALTHVSVIMIIATVPAFIQLSRYGTTESLLMMFVTVLLYYAICMIQGKISLSTFTHASIIFLGLALGTKVSALVFAAIPITALLFVAAQKTHSIFKILFQMVYLATGAIVIFALASPYNFLAYSDFLGSMNYESAVGLGTYRAFYTRQFEYALPVIFSFVRIFPYALSVPVFVLFCISFVALPYNRLNNFLRLQWVVFFGSTAIVYAKWSRFIAPAFPIMVVMAILFVLWIIRALFDYDEENGPIRMTVLRVYGIILIVFCCMTGIAFLTIYQVRDVRFIASKWIYTHIPADALILSETANVVDIPMEDLYRGEKPAGKHYRNISFNFYDLEEVPSLQMDLSDHLENAEYIFVPSRRIYYNHTCYRNINGKIQKVQSVAGYVPDYCDRLEDRYPRLNAYYDGLFSGTFGFQKVAEFSSFPQISFLGRTLFKLPDEGAEETATVFDHPVIMIFKKM